MTVYTCPYCDSENVFNDAYVNVNDPDDVRIFDALFCMDCEEHLKCVTHKEV